MSAEALTASRQAMSHAKEAMPQGAEQYVPRLNDATDVLERALNVSDPSGCARAAAVPVTHRPLALRAPDGSVIPLPEGGVVDLGREGLLQHHVPATATLVSRLHASLVRGGDDLWVVVRGQRPVEVTSPQMTYRLARRGDKADVANRLRLGLEEQRRETNLEALLQSLRARYVVVPTLPLPSAGPAAQEPG